MPDLDARDFAEIEAIEAQIDGLKERMKADKRALRAKIKTIRVRIWMRHKRAKDAQANG